MKVCPECGLTMRRETSSGTLEFVSSCGYREKGKPGDLQVKSGTPNSEETTEMYQVYIRNSPFDRVSQQVKRDCPECGLDYMTQIRVGSREDVIWTCKCGHGVTQTGQKLTLFKGKPLVNK